MTITRSRAKRAGKHLKSGLGDARELIVAMDSLSEWKKIHTKPLNLALGELGDIARKIDAGALLASRQKRSHSIIEKLKREPTMALDKMQDIAGCRAVLMVQKDVMKVVNLLRKKKHIKVAHNYIKRPKIDGYRGVHLIGQYENPSLGKLLVEFQVRTQIQHAWATAGEITELFTSKSIKNLGGDTRWKELYKNIADCFSVIDVELARKDLDFREVQGDDLIRELKHVLPPKLRQTVNNIKKQQYELKVIDRFEAYRNSLRLVEQEQEKQSGYSDGYFLIHVTSLMSLKVQVSFGYYNKEKLSEAQALTYTLEKSISNDDSQLVVLVSSQAIGGLKATYPNYFADSHLFLSLLRAIIKV